jgi:hypothetical protein
VVAESVVAHSFTHLQSSPLWFVLTFPSSAAKLSSILALAAVTQSYCPMILWVTMISRASIFHNVSVKRSVRVLLEVVDHTIYSITLCVHPASSSLCRAR